MRLHIFRPEGGRTNFGDELNVYLWPLILPELDRWGPGLFLGIGTLLEEGRTPKERPLIVFGSGAGYGPVPDLTGADVRFVRGPKTASVIGMPERWITDPGILVATLMRRSEHPSIPVAFMPRWNTILHDRSLKSRLEDIGIATIDPLSAVPDVLAQIANTELLISETLHGAVVADALRVPWIPALSAQGHTFKNFDFCLSLGLAYHPADLNVVSLPWVAKNIPPQLSSDAVHHSRLSEVERAVRLLRVDLGA